ncbi:hypothetical protein [Flavobacterium tructae]|uniref:TIGR03032 family protein n=1 Tax=Flavobacterium tructae TaxID=1114873 RepID=A0A1S1J4H5_9FLAO|nr:hypothetical protein [Flavobacterium tructae]OHT44638.1 hypothetical protein BHE19_13085 [Flavobacterium tructae]OXB19224.1 hypothetical protein B0A71_11785 [Flavobacterium tructae]
MKLEFNSKLRNYIVLSVLNQEEILISKRNSIFIYNILTEDIKFILSLPCSYTLNFLSKSGLITRVLRLGVRYALTISENKLLVVFDKKFFEVNILEGTYKITFNITRGNRPLNIANVENINNFDDSLYFGEYFANFERVPVNIYQRLKDSSWKIVYTFPEGTIEHIHAIVPDKFRDCLWILTGDFNKASGIWMAKNNFEEVTPILLGQQIFRSCVAFPEEKGIIYATDSQFENNSIRILHEKNNEWVSDFICEINGPAIYGCKVKNDLFFSTSVEGDSIAKGKFLKYLDREAGPGIKENFSHIVGGNFEKGFNILTKNKKDFFPFILFQFGAITFPTGINETDFLFSYNISLKKNNLNTEIFKINN